MRKLSFLIIALSLISKVAFANNSTEEIIVDASLPLEFLKLDTLITKDDFIKANKEIKVRDVNSICKMISNLGSHLRIAKDLDSILLTNSVDKDYFLQRGYSNARCLGNHFLIQSMHNDRLAFREFVAYGLNVNRPLQFSKKVGTPLDFAFDEYYGLKNAGENPSKWHGFITFLKSKGGKTCKELALKCDISY